MGNIDTVLVINFYILTQVRDDMKEKTLCAVYTRVSTDNQAEIEFNSCEAQKEKIEHFVKSQNGFKVYDYFNDEGYSGKDTNRPELQRMMEVIEKGHINCVITYKMDRLTRSPRDFYQLIELFEKHKVDFISVTERFDTSTPSGRLLRNIMLTFAQFERELASERTKDKLLQRAEKGMWNGGTVPFGYKAVNKKLIINESEAKIVRFVYENYIKSGSLAYVYNLLKNRKYYHRTGNVFLKSVLSGLLRNMVYTGKIKYGGKIYQGIHKPIISQEMFNIAQIKHKEAPSHRKKYKEFLLGGIVKCAECGSIMTPSYVTKIRKDRHIRYYYYRCTCTYKKDWKACSIKQVNANRLEDYIFDNLKRIYLDKSYIDNLIFRKQYENAKSSSPEGEGFSQGCRTIKKYIKNILFSKETIQVNVCVGNTVNDEEGILEQASGKSDANTQMECAKHVNSNRIEQYKNGIKYMENAGSVADEPRRSDKGRGAEVVRPKGANSLSEERSDERRAEKIKRARSNFKRPDPSFFIGSSNWTRTSNPLVNSQVLYH